MRRLKASQITGALTAGDEGLRLALRKRYALQGVPLADNELIITNGAMEALNLCLQAVTQPGDVVVVESPTFYAALQALERLHLKAVEVATDPQEGVDLDALAELLARQKVAACWFMPSFQNPLGALMPVARRQALVALLAQHGVPLIEDDVYGELHDGARRPLPAKAFDQQGEVLHCSSFSKCLAPGYRVGWAAAGRYAPQVERLKMMTSLATAIPPQLALTDYLAQGGYDRHLRRLREALAAQRTHALKLVERQFPAGTRVTRPEGGYFLWLELPPQVDALALHQRARARIDQHRARRAVLCRPPLHPPPAAERGPPGGMRGLTTRSGRWGGWRCSWGHERGSIHRWTRKVSQLQLGAAHVPSRPRKLSVWSGRVFGQAPRPLGRPLPLHPLPARPRRALGDLGGVS